MPFNVIGLISGGKDSLYSLAHCVRNGHNVVALANLHPPLKCDTSEEGADLDSFMYQTVGHSIIPLYAEALGIPLYRHEIRGSAKQTGRDYDTSSNTSSTDETEDMFRLIQNVLIHHPEANSLSAGAILSTYQRTRVESVATRLGLTPLAYLWQYPALPLPPSREDSLTGLLDDMSSAGCDARIVKVASGGIRTNLLSCNVADPTTRARLVSGLSPFFSDAGQEFALRGALLGEGGEYETLALYGPTPLWRQRITVDFTHTFGAEGGASYSSFARAKVVPRDDDGRTEDVPGPGIWDKRFASVISSLARGSTMSSIQPKAARRLEPNSLRLAYIRNQCSLQLGNITTMASNISPAEQLERIIDSIPDIIKSRSSGAQSSLPFHPRNIVSATLILRSIEDFAVLNPIYAAKMWQKGLPNPPARVTLAAPLPDGIDVSLSLLYDPNSTDHQQRKGLHVQSLSYWAPANIGPYSQAISVPIRACEPTSSGADGDGNDMASIASAFEVVHMAGQIPLIPASMTMLECPFHHQAALALQHLWRIGQERGVDTWNGAGVTYLAQAEGNPEDMAERAGIAAKLWKLAHLTNEQGAHYPSLDGEGRQSNATEASNGEDEEEDKDIDVWDLQQMNRAVGGSALNLTVGRHLHVLPNYEVFSNKTSDLPGRFPMHKMKQFPFIPPFIAAHVAGLPRHAPVEWWSCGLAGLKQAVDNDLCRVFSLHHELGGGIFISGIAIKHVRNEGSTTEPAWTEITTTQGKIRGTQVGSFTFFLSILIDDHWNEADPFNKLGSLNNIGNVLFEEGADMRIDWVTASAFLNLGCQSVKGDVLGNIGLMEMATVIQCYRVWASTEGSNKGEETPSVPENGRSWGETREVAAAFICRIDADPASSRRSNQSDTH